MPQAFNAVSQEESAGLGANIDAEAQNNGIQLERRHGRCKYMYISPKVQMIVAGIVATVALIGIIGHLATSKGSPKGQWPPPGVAIELYEDSIYQSKKAAKFDLQLEAGKSYMQFTKMTTTSEYDFGQTDFAETLHMMIDGRLDVSEWTYDGKPQGYKIGVTFDQVAVGTEDSSGDSSYYNSKAENGDTDFDGVLQSMVGETITIDVDESYEIMDEEDNQNSLEQLEQQYSFGTTTGLSAIDQVTQITNLKAMLPSDPEKSYLPGDEWDITYNTDVEFQGRTSFVGYVNYNGFECAVLSTWAYINQETNNLLGDGGLDDWGLGDYVEIENGGLDVTIFWDVKENIPRFAKMQLDMTTEIDQEYGDAEADELGDSMEDETTELPMSEEIEIYVAPL